MGFDVFVQYFEDGEAELVSINSLRDIFAPNVREESDNFWRIVYDDRTDGQWYNGTMSYSHTR